MPNRDYARPKSSKSGGQLIILLLVTLILLVFGLALWLLKTTSPAPVIPAAVVAEEKPKSTLPSRPEEVYSYIRDLETREVPVDKNTKFAQLSAEQERQLQQRKKEEEKQLEAVTAKPEVEQTPEQKAAEAKLAEEKRKQAELKKQEEAKLKAEQMKQEQLKAEQTKQEQAKLDQTKADQTKVEQAKTAGKEEQPKPTSGKFGLQCGAFKNKAQAENMQARLSMAGYNARISSSAEWNRVFVGPVGDRASAVKAQSNAKSVAECLVVAM